MSSQQNMEKFAASSLVSISTLYNYCLASDLVTEYSARIGKTAYKTLWYRMSTDHIRIISMIMLRAQQPFHLTGLKLWSCSLESFKKVKFLLKEFLQIVYALHSSSTDNEYDSFNVHALANCLAKQLIKLRIDRIDKD